MSSTAAGGSEIARELMAGAGSVAVLTGAGISTDSGIPDFRGPNGVWTKNPGAERRATIAHYLADPEVRRQAWQIRLESEMWQARPNPGHRALAELHQQGRLHTLVTQNIDGLHVEAGVPADDVVEVHGTVHRYQCVACEASGPMAEALDRVRAGEEDPPCRVCGAILKSATVMFGQSLDPSALERAERSAVEAELLLCVGTSLSVYPVAGMVPLALRAGHPVVIVNAEPTPFDDVAAAVLHASASEALPVLVAPIGASEASAHRDAGGAEPG